MRLFNLRKKAVRTYSSVTESGLPQATWTGIDPSLLSKAGYQKCMAVYACVNLVSQTASQLDWILQKRPRDSRGQIEEMGQDHELMKLLARPNPKQGKVAFFENMSGFILLAGNSYIHKAGPDTGANRGKARELRLLFPSLVEIVPGTRENPIKEYKYNISYSKPDHYRPEDVLHTKLFHPNDEWYGLSPLEVAARGIDVSNMIEEWNMRLLKNDCRLPGMWKVTGYNFEGTEKKDFEIELAEKFHGYKNAGRSPVIEGDVEWKDLAVSPKDMDWLSLDKTTIRKICSIYNVAPELIGDADNKTYSNYQEARKALYMEAIIPLANLVRDELNYWLVPQFGERLYLDYDRDKIDALKENRETLFSYVKMADWLSDNEKRELTGYDNIGPEGDVIWKPINLISASTAPKEPKKSAGLLTKANKGHWNTPERKRALWDNFMLLLRAKEKAIEPLAESFLKEQTKRVSDALSGLSSLAQVKPDKVLKVKDEASKYHEKTRGWYADAFITAGESGMVISKGELYVLESKALNLFDLTPELEAQLKALIFDSGIKISETTLEKIYAMLKMAELEDWTIKEFTKNLLEKLPELTPVRAKTIADTETHTVENWGTNEGYKQSEFIKRRGWLSAFLATTRAAHAAADAKYSDNPIPLDQPFNVGGEKLMYPGDRTNGSAGNTVNCKCSTYPDVGGDEE